MSLICNELDVLVCPACHSKLSLESDKLVCTGCRVQFAISNGLVDLCCHGINLPMLFVKDLQRAHILRSRSNELDIPELIRLCYELPASRDHSSLNISVDFMLRGEERMKDALAKFDTLARQKGWYLPEHATVLDLGCGVGTATGHLTKKFNKVFAVNPAWDEMVIAERVNREWFGGRMTLLRAFGECLPFRDETFDLVCALDIIEHVLEPMKVLREVERVLKPGGLFIFNSPNQYNIVSADGHVHVRFVGFIPSNMRESYVRWRTGGVSWAMRNVHLLSYWKLNRYLKRLTRCDFHFRTFVPANKKSSWKGLKGRLVCSVPGMRFLANRFFRAFGNVHDVVVKKNDHSINHS